MLSKVNYHPTYREANTMKRNSKTYRLQLIKEAVERNERCMSSDPMVRHIQDIISSTSHETEVDMVSNHRFSGYHYDQQVEGWVADSWN